MTLATMRLLAIGTQPATHPESSADSWKPIDFTPSDVCNLSRVYVGTVAQFRVTPDNISDEALAIQRLKTTCGCTNVHVDLDAIPLKGSATLTGTIRSPSTPRTLNVSVELQVLGSDSGRRTWVKYPVVAHFVSSISIESKIDEVTPNGQSRISRIGNIIIQNISPNKVAVEAATFQCDNVRLSPRKLLLDPASSQSIAVEVEGTEESNGFARISIDDGREVHMVPLKVRIAGRAKAVPQVLILGGVTVKGDRAESTFPSQLAIRGEVLKNNTVVVASLPAMLENARLTVISPFEVNLKFDIAISPRKSRLRGLIELQVISSSKEVVQTLEIPVVGFVKP